MLFCRRPILSQHIDVLKQHVRQFGQHVDMLKQHVYNTSRFLVYVTRYGREWALATQFLRNGIQRERRLTSCLKFPLTSSSPPRNARACLDKYRQQSKSTFMTFLFSSRSCSSCASSCFPALLIATSTRLFFCLKCPNRAAASL